LKRILVTACGGAPSIGFVRSLRDADEEFYIIGCDCNAYTLQRTETDEAILCPRAKEPEYIPFLKKIIKDKGVDFIHAQPDVEVGILSKHREELDTRTFFPAKRTVEILRDKSRSFEYWKKAGLKVPDTMMIKNESDLKRAFERFGSDIWLREIEGAAGRGSLSGPTYSLAKEWIAYRNGWGRYTAARRLTRDTVTWMSIYKEGELVVAQGRKRLYWEFADRTQSGVTGLTGAGMTISDPVVDKVAQQAVFAVDDNPSGIFSVDLTYDQDGIPNPTEINIGKFFTTHYFFTRAGLNMPYIYLKLAFDEEIPQIPQKINPLPENLLWIRGMDVQPVLTRRSVVREALKQYELVKCTL
jgi:hypothetical protein